MPTMSARTEFAMEKLLSIARFLLEMVQEYDCYTIPSFFSPAMHQAEILIHVSTQAMLTITRFINISTSSNLVMQSLLPAVPAIVHGDRGPMKAKRSDL